VASIALNSGLVCYPPEQAARIRDAYAAADPDWTYTVEVYDSGYAKVRIEDEDGEFVGWAEE
jgi:hypothetical protein